MNARQKAKHWKKKYQELWEDYIASAMAVQGIMDIAGKQIQQLRDSQVTCSHEMIFSKPVAVGDSIARDMLVQLIAKPEFKQAVQFFGHSDPGTGEYVLRTEVTVVIPEVDDEQ